jgi:SAM-dependent methyltransferase
MPANFTTSDEATLAELDTLLSDIEDSRWNRFYSNRAKPCPFFGKEADESLAEWVRAGIIAPGRALDLGCGNGRNAIFLAQNGFAVEAVDYSRAAIEWATERANEAGAHVELRCQSVFELKPEPGAYDLVYDSGCFHHIPPHRRSAYIGLVSAALRPGGFFGLACFKPEGGSGYADEEVYERKSLGGGLGYTEEQLREHWSGAFQIQVLREMAKPGAGSGLFGERFLWVLLAQKR